MSNSSVDSAPDTRHIGPDDGTPEWQWAECRHLAAVPPIEIDDLIPTDGRLVVVAPHPDDEVLAAGGLLALAAEIGRDIALVAVTDGSASHPDSRLWSRERLAAERPRETHAALATLGVHPQMHVRLGLPDGGLAGQEAELARQLQAVLRPRDMVFTTWELDGHPDHEATGRATARAARQAGARCVQAPVWAWHWACPGDERLPWHRARRLRLPASVVRRKESAMGAFISQLAPDPSTGAGPVLRSTTVDRVSRSFEVFFLP